MPWYLTGSRWWASVIRRELSLSHQATWSPISDQNGFVKYCYQYRIQRGGKCGAYRRISRNDETLDRETDNLTSCCHSSRSYISLVRGSDDARCALRAFSIRNLNTLKIYSCCREIPAAAPLSHCPLAGERGFHDCLETLLLKQQFYKCNVAVFSPVYPSFLAGCEYNFIDKTQKESWNIFDTVLPIWQ